MAKPHLRPDEDRRMHDALVIVDRRKGKFVVYGQTLLLLGLAATLLWLVID